MRPLFSDESENGHAVRLARNLRPGTDGSDGVDRDRRRSPRHGGARSGAAVRLHRRLRGLAERPRLGLATAAFAVAALFFFHQHRRAGYDNADLVRLAMLAATVAGTAIITGLLRKRLTDAFSWERKQHAAAERLSAALDQVEIGIVLLDADTRAEFINRAFRDYFALPDEKADSKPPFIALMHHGRDTRAWEMPEDEWNDFIAQRIRLMRAGDQTPINITLRDGQVLRFSCTALPDGGRMLSYTPVTDLVRHTDDPAQIDYYQSLRGGGVRTGTRICARLNERAISKSCAHDSGSDAFPLHASARA